MADIPTPGGNSVRMHTATPLMAPNYVWTDNRGLHFTEYWDRPSVTTSCYASPKHQADCMDAVTRGQLSTLAPVIGCTGHAETLLPDETQFLVNAMAQLGFQRQAPPTIACQQHHPGGSFF
jgi:hypothetical protein